MKANTSSTLLSGVAILLGCVACATPSGTRFPSPEAAMSAVAAVVRSGEATDVERIFGEGSVEVLRSGDPAVDRANEERVAALIDEGVAMEDGGRGRRIALIGRARWPFPIPLVSAGEGWRFDMETGAEEIRNRRIGRNEIATIETLQAVVAAQEEYASAGRGGAPAAFARRFAATAAKQDGLYWPTAPGEPESPLGALVAQAAVEGDAATVVPYHGYFYRMLDAQGARAPGGAKSYVDAQGLMSGGFAVVAWPAAHGNSGVMTFIVDRLGVVFQRDLGGDTGALVPPVAVYDPDERWVPVRP